MNELNRLALTVRRADKRMQEGEALHVAVDHATSYTELRIVAKMLLDKCRVEACGWAQSNLHGHKIRNEQRDRGMDGTRDLHTDSPRDRRHQRRPRYGKE